MTAVRIAGRHGKLCRASSWRGRLLTATSASVFVGNGSTLIVCHALQRQRMLRRETASIPAEAEQPKRERVTEDDASRNSDDAAQTAHAAEGTTKNSILPHHDQQPGERDFRASFIEGSQQEEASPSANEPWTDAGGRINEENSRPSSRTRTSGFISNSGSTRTSSVSHAPAHPGHDEQVVLDRQALAHATGGSSFVAGYVEKAAGVGSAPKEENGETKGEDDKAALKKAAEENAAQVLGVANGLFDTLKKTLDNLHQILRIAENSVISEDGDGLKAVPEIGQALQGGGVAEKAANNVNLAKEINELKRKQYAEMKKAQRKRIKDLPVKVEIRTTSNGEVVSVQPAPRPAEGKKSPAADQGDNMINEDDDEEDSDRRSGQEGSENVHGSENDASNDNRASGAKGSNDTETAEEEEPADLSPGSPADNKESSASDSEEEPTRPTTSDAVRSPPGSASTGAGAPVPAATDVTVDEDSPRGKAVDVVTNLDEEPSPSNGNRYTESTAADNSWNVFTDYYGGEKHEWDRS
ncbi:unnamed protein product [Amoebophrya sp. A25]|nr:unnamed protein product [Amoebophrya sp. A25]|eukprot:GSA25T00009959001.1